MKKISVCLALMILAAGFVCGATTPKTLSFSGYSQFLLEYGQQKKFSIPLVVFVLNGKLSDKITYKVEADIANQNLREAWISYTIAPWFRLRAGRQFMFYTMSLPPGLVETVEYPEATSLATVYDIGLVADGDLGKHFRYYAGIVNGTTAGNADNNNAKDMYGHLIWQPKDNLSFGATYQHGNQLEGKRIRYGSHVKWQIDPKIYVFGEYFHEEGTVKARDGWYILTVANLKSKLQLVNQWDVFSDKNTNAGLETVWTFGFNYFPINDLKLQANYILSFKERDKILVRAQVSF